GLLIGPTEQEPNLDIVVINDSGGAIFHGLEHGEVAERPGMSSVVERFFGTPHTVDIDALCAAHGIQHERLTSEQQLIHVLGDPTVGRRVLEVVSDRSQRPQVHAAVQNAVRATFV
ncbi:MAG TPA: 2-succinyl-5-enolpyruvyl-6-hydroxy-3-cyclohexene-1-carboxylate synthase, partial [Candidatus Yaniella excrementavium]|nr:2-succinyl-5-enolpyruvyl-6-hydroxy-3-cyclohexene-1-carboxylate synthase [Candidatus Yaniella excrementavium]